MAGLQTAIETSRCGRCDKDSHMKVHSTYIVVWHIHTYVCDIAQRWLACELERDSFVNGSIRAIQMGGDL